MIRQGGVPIDISKIAAVIKGRLDSIAMIIDGEVMTDLYEPREAYEVLEGTARGIAEILAAANPGFNSAAFVAACGFREGNAR